MKTSMSVLAGQHPYFPAGTQQVIKYTLTFWAYGGATNYGTRYRVSSYNTESASYISTRGHAVNISNEYGIAQPAVGDSGATSSNYLTWMYGITGSGSVGWSTTVKKIPNIWYNANSGGGPTFLQMGKIPEYQYDSNRDFTFSSQIGFGEVEFRFGKLLRAPLLSNGSYYIAPQPATNSYRPAIGTDEYNDKVESSVTVGSCTSSSCYDAGAIRWVGALASTAFNVDRINADIDVGDTETLLAYFKGVASYA
tara:strand:- start:1641 stop:2396 length:756 start_codon:yes stop_codon:yes gene_type:complete